MIFPPLLPDGALDGMPFWLRVIIALPGALIICIFLAAFFVILSPLYIVARIADYGGRQEWFDSLLGVNNDQRSQQQSPKPGP